MLDSINLGSKMIDQSGDSSDKDKALESLLGSMKPKLTKWKNEPSVADLMNDYTRASSYHSSQMNKISKWLKLIHTQTDTSKIKVGRSGISPKMIRRLCEWRYSSLASSILNEKNLFHVQASLPDYQLAGIQNSLVLNFQFNNLINKVKFVNDLVRTAVNEGTAIVRIGWDIEQQTKEKVVPVYEYLEADEIETSMIMQAMQQIQQEIEQTGVEYADETETFQTMPEDLAESIKASQEYGIPVIARNTGKTQILKEVIDTKNRPSVKVLNNNDLIVDPTCEGDFSKAKFVIYKYYTSISELKMMNQKYPDTYHNLDKLGIRSNSGETLNSINELVTLPNDVFSDLLSGSERNNGFEFKDKPRQQLVAYEYWGYWDIDGTGVAQSIVATIVEGVMIKITRNPFPDNGLPFVAIQYMPVKGSIYGEPDAELVSDNQQIATALTRSIVDLNARSAAGQTAIPKGFLDIANARKFRTGEDYEYNPMGMHPAEAIYMHTSSEVPQSVMMMLQAQYAEAESATGIKAFQNGIDGNAYGQVVQGMSQAITAMTQREGDIIFRISKGLEEIGNKILRMNQEWLNEEEVIAISGGQFIPIKKEDLAGDFFLSVRLKSNSESQGKAQQMTFLAQTLGQDSDWGLKKMMMLEIGQLYNLESFVTWLRDYEPQPDPIQQELAQIELQIQKAKLEKELAEAEYYRKRSEFIDAQTQNTQSDTDLKALDFMEQQEGVKHARQREIVEAQARAQNEGKRQDAELKRQTTLDKARMDNATKMATTANKQNTRQNENKPRQLPNPELGAVPKGLFRDIGLGNYIRGDGNSVGNKI